MSSLLATRYYDSPEGKDVAGKLIATNKYAVGFGLAFSTFDVLLYSKTQGYLQTISRFAYNLGPMIGMASVFTITTYAATKYRHQDDRWNYVLGGLAAGAVYGSWRRSVVAGGVSGIFFAIAAAVKKTSKIEGWVFFPKPKYVQYNSINRHDFTLFEEREKNYTTYKEEPDEEECTCKSHKK